MSRRGAIEITLPANCQQCDKHAELRPYGANGEYICFQCGMKDKATTERRFSQHVLGEGTHPMTLRPAEEVLIELNAFVSIFADKGPLPPSAVAVIHADRIATARRVVEGLAAEHRMHETLARNVGLEDDAKWEASVAGSLEELANNPTALEALLLKETK